MFEGGREVVLLNWQLWLNSELFVTVMSQPAMFNELDRLQFTVQENMNMPGIVHKRADS